MALEHLTDQNIQDYLDRNLSADQSAKVRQHLNECAACRSQFEVYQKLYSELSAEVSVALSPAFVTAIMQKIQQEAPITFHIKIRDILLSVLGLLFAVSTTFYFVDLKSIYVSIEKSLKPQLQSLQIIFVKAIALISELDININLFLFAGLVLLILILTDRLIYRYKDKISSLMKILPALI